MLSQVAVGIDVPALASRSRDIPSIIKTLLAGTEPRRRPVLSAATMQVLMRWDWPGNVAELRQVLLGLAAELPGQSVSPYHLPERMWDAANRQAADPDRVGRADRDPCGAPTEPWQPVEGGEPARHRPDHLVPQAPRTRDRRRPPRVTARRSRRAVTAPRRRPPRRGRAGCRGRRPLPGRARSASTRLAGGRREARPPPPWRQG